MLLVIVICSLVINSTAKRLYKNETRFFFPFFFRTSNSWYFLFDETKLTDFYNWNRVKLRYCDGASFAGDAKFDNGVSC